MRANASWLSSACGEEMDALSAVSILLTGAAGTAMAGVWPVVDTAGAGGAAADDALDSARGATGVVSRPS